ncbi:MAG: nuclear transport factor 2 family protein [Solirubrobacteraceae bacterium]
MIEQATAAELEREVRRILGLLDAMDVRGLAARLTDDAQGVDEISRSWIRGRAALDAYFAQLEGTVSGVRSQLSDFHAATWDDVGLVTFVLDQTYKSNGQEQRITAPASMVFRRDDDDWKAVLIHAVPIPE